MQLIIGSIIALFGALLGFMASLIANSLKRKWDQADRKKRAIRLLETVLEEIEVGYDRVKTLEKYFKTKTESYSAIYTEIWDSAKIDLAVNIDNQEILKLLFKFHNAFYLINFNMGRGAFGVGGAWAENFLPQLEEDLPKLRNKVEALSEEDSKSPKIKTDI